MTNVMTGRLAALAAAAAAMLVLVIWIGWLTRRADHALDLARAAQARASAFESQARLNAATVSIGEARARNTAAAVQHAEEAKDDVERSPDLDGALAAYRDGLERVRSAGRAAVEPEPNGGRPERHP